MNISLLQIQSINEWNIEIIDPDIMNFWYDWGVSIKSGNSGILHVAYYKWPGRNLNYAWKINDIWSIETVDSDGPVGSFCSIDVDPKILGLSLLYNIYYFFLSLV